MSKEKFTSEWEKYTKLDKLGFITCIILLVSYVLMLIYYSYIDPKLNEMFSLTYIGVDVTLLNHIALICMAAGLFSISFWYGIIVEKIFFPETKDEILIKNKKKEFYNQYPFELAQQKLKELKLELKLKQIKANIKEIKND